MMRIVMRVSESICQATAAASILYLAEAVTQSVLVLYTGRLYTDVAVSTLVDCVVPSGRGM